MTSLLISYNNNNFLTLSTEWFSNYFFIAWQCKPRIKGVRSGQRWTSEAGHELRKTWPVTHLSHPWCARHGDEQAVCWLLKEAPGNFRNITCKLSEFWRISSLELERKAVPFFVIHQVIFVTNTFCRFWGFTSILLRFFFPYAIKLSRRVNFWKGKLLSLQLSAVD